MTKPPLKYKINKTDLFFKENEVESDFHLRKTLFLQQLKSSSDKQRYKHYTESYTSGKSLTVGFIIKYLPNNIKQIISTLRNEKKSNDLRKSKICTLKRI